MSALVKKFSKDWQLLPLVATMLFGGGLAGFKIYDKEMTPLFTRSLVRILTLVSS